MSDTLITIPTHANNKPAPQEQILFNALPALKATPPKTPYACVYVKGYKSPFDGGEGTFCYDPLKAKVDNGGTVIQGWVRQYSGAVNVRWFGAKADGSNAAKAIQSAIDSGASEVFLPAGTYRLDGKKKKRILNLRSNLRLFGEAGTVLDFSHNRIGDHHSVRESYIAGQGHIGKARKILSGAVEGSRSVETEPTKKLHAGDLVLVSSSDTVDRKQAVKIGELVYVESVDDNGTVVFQTALSDTYRTDPKLFRVNPLKNLTIENLKIIGSGRPQLKGRADLGIVIQYGSDITVKNCEFVNVDNTAVDLESVIGFHLENNTVRFGPKGKNKAIQYGLKYSNASRDGYIVGNNIYNGKHGIVQGHTTTIPGISRNVIISGNNISGTWHAGISTHASGNSITVSGNQLRGCMRGIESRIPNMIITNNLLTDIKTHGIMVKDDSYNITVSGNTIIRSGLYGIYIYKLRSKKSNIMISGNMVSDSYGGVAVSTKSTSVPLENMIITDNIFSHIERNGVSTEGEVSVDIVGNRFSRIGKNAIYIRGNQNAVVQSNTIKECSVALRLDGNVYDTDHLYFCGNWIKSCKRKFVDTAVGNDIAFCRSLGHL